MIRGPCASRWVYTGYTFALGARMGWCSLNRTIETSAVRPRHLTLSYLPVCKTFRIRYLSKQLNLVYGALRMGGMHED